jgi:hypothetical protein
MSKNMEPERLQMTAQRMRVAFWISKATRSQEHVRTRALTHPLTPTTHKHAHTHIHTEKYVIIIAFPQQQLLRERASLLRYTHIAFLVSAFFDFSLQPFSYRHE